MGDDLSRSYIRLTGDGTEHKLLVAFQFNETFQRINAYACELAHCNGVTIGPITTGPNGEELRRITLVNTRMGQVQADSSVDYDAFGTINLTMLVQVSSTSPYPPPPDCTGLDSVRATYSDDGPPFSICPPPADPDAGFAYTGTDLVEGEPVYYMRDASFNSILVFTNGGSVTRVMYSTAGGNGLEGECNGTVCAGVTISPPDGDGNRAITFSNTLVYENEGGLTLETVRRIRLNGTITGIPPAPAGASGQIARRAARK
jgi:hypothetical protein